MNESINIIIRSNGEGFYATSPQAPGLVYGRSSLEELRADLADVFSFHFDRPGPFVFAEHNERHYQTGDREIVTRVAVDTHIEAREEVQGRLERALTVPAWAKSLTDKPANQVGEIVYVCAVPTDTLGWLSCQLNSQSDAITVAVAVADFYVFTFSVVHGEEYASINSIGFGRGYSSHTTISQIMRDTPILQPATVQAMLV